MKKIVVDPEYLTSLCGKLNGAAAGLQATKAQLSHLSTPAMPPATAKAVREAVDQAKTVLDNTRTECAEMSKQLVKRKNFQPPEAYPTFEPTAKLMIDAQGRADRLAKKFKDGKATIKDDLKFVDDDELQLQLYISLGEKGFNRYLKQMDARFDLARDLINERTWKERKDKEMAGYFDGHEKWLGKHHMGWAYPKGVVTGVFKGGSSLDASIYSMYGMVADLSDKRRKMWHDLGMPTNAEAAGKAIEYSLKHPDELAKGLVAWDTFKQGKIGEGIGEVGFSVTLLVATQGLGTAAVGADAAKVAVAATRTRDLAYASMRNAARNADRLEAQAAKFQKMAQDSKLPSGQPGGSGRNVNFEQTRAARLDADNAAAMAQRYRDVAASAERRMNAAHEVFVQSGARAVGSSVVASVELLTGINLTPVRSIRNWLSSAVGGMMTIQPHVPNPASGAGAEIRQAAGQERGPNT